MTSTLDTIASEKSTSLVPVFERIAEMANLPVNWDSYGAAPLTARAVAQACALIAAVAEEREGASGTRRVPWTSAPIADGGLQIEWVGRAASIEVQVAPDGTLGYLIQRGEADRTEYEESDDTPMDAMVGIVAQVLAS